jgi:4-hydroxy-2-oxovalerate aldolase
LKIAEPFAEKAELGMFMLAANAEEEAIRKVKESGMRFIRIGANAGDGAASQRAISLVKEAGLTARYSLMKAYVLSAEELAKESLMLESFGADEVTVMDSAGTMLPGQVTQYVKALTECLHIPVAFHGHSNLGLCMANALAAYEAGAQVIDCSIMGMARSAGNIPTEVAAAVFQRLGMETGIDFYGMLDFIDNKLGPEMKKVGYDRALTPEELVYGLSGCHSSFAALFERIAEEHKVNRYQLIIEVSKLDQKAPSEALIHSVAERLK